MTAALAPGTARPAVARQRLAAAARTALVVVAWLFAAGVLGQALSAGLAVFVGPGYWARHRAFVHTFEWLSVAAVVLAHVGRTPRAVKVAAWLTVVLLFAQYATAHMLERPGRERLAALHPVSAMFLFWTAAELVRGAMRARRVPGDGRAGGDGRP